MRHVTRSRIGAVSLAVAVLSSLLVPIAAIAAPPTGLDRASLPGAPSASRLADVVAGGPGFIAVGGSVDTTTGATSAEIWTSVDGTAWERVSLSGDAATGQVSGIAAIDGGFLAVGGFCCSDQGRVWSSTDGLAWTLQPEAPQMADATLFDVAELADGSVVAIGCVAVMECGGGIAFRSTDGGVTWSDPVALPGLLLELAPTAGGVAAVGTSQTYEGAAMAALSPDGVTWTGATLASGLGTLDSLVASGGGALAVGSSEATLGATPRSLVAVTEGTAWGAVLDGRVRGARFQAAAWLPDAAAATGVVLVAGGSIQSTDRTRPAAWWSADAVTWTRIRIATGRGEVLALAAGADGTIVAVGWTGADDSVAAAWSGVASAG